ncbi:MAG: NERD domain-containing protein [Patescibacteria group bacterium]|nr:NERD domain-containing protein [Patescibacteria group bacterium]
MSGSAAEERIRGKAEALLRLRYPEARIIHELVLEQGGVRIDLAAVTADRIIAVEIKSEKDVLARLSRQLARAVEIAGDVWLCIAEKHVAKLEAARGWSDLSGVERDAADALDRALSRCAIFVERGGPDGELMLHWSSLGARNTPFPDPRAVFDLLWAAEMRAATRLDTTRDQMTRRAVEALSGGEIRRIACAALRRRPFARADAPAERAA